MGCTWWLRDNLPYLITHSANICKGPIVSWGLCYVLETQGWSNAAPMGFPAQCHAQDGSGHSGCERDSLTTTHMPFFFLLSSISKLIQSKRQLLKSRYFILMWVIPIISYIKMSDFSCHPTGGRNVASDLFYHCMCICFYFVYGTWEAAAKLVLHSKCGNRSLKWDPDLT